MYNSFTASKNYNVYNLINYNNSKNELKFFLHLQKIKKNTLSINIVQTYEETAHKKIFFIVKCLGGFEI